MLLVCAELQTRIKCYQRKIELIIATDKEKDPLFDFKSMYEEDLESFKKSFI